jgi:hypothetical protein
VARKPKKRLANSTNTSALLPDSMEQAIANFRRVVGIPAQVRL